MEFSNKIILITGAGSGIGRVTACEFAKAGGTVVVSDINEKGGQETVQQIEAEGGQAVFIKANVAEYKEVENLIHTTISKFERIDIAVNNAGISGSYARTADTSPANWDKVMTINASGVFYCMKLELQQMVQQKGGVIVNTASVAGLKGLPNSLPYVASKHAVVGMTKTAAMEYARKNIRINAICPAFTVTPLFDPEAMDNFSTGLSDKLKAAIPMRRFGTSLEIANAILWLCSDKSSFVTGLALPIDGGIMA